MSAGQADPVQVTQELIELGTNLDAKPLPALEDVACWQPGDIPHGLDVDLNEYPVALLKLKKCRSFRADLRHKLTLIIRAHGGYGHCGIEKASKALGVARQTLWKWLRWTTVPKTRVGFERIDRLYSESLEKLVAEKLKRKRKRKRKCAGSNATASPVTG